MYTQIRPTLPPKVIIALLVIVFSLITMYLPAIHGPFVLDDLSNIPQTKTTLNSFSDFVKIAMSNDSGPSGRPISVASFSLNHHFWGSGSTSFKITNLLIHVTNAILVFFFVKSLLSFTKVQEVITPAFSTSHIALLISLIWSIHPLQVSTVMYVVQRMTLLMTFFSLSALLLYMTARKRQLSNRPFATVAFFCAGICALLAIFSKENGALIPAYLLILEICIVRFRMTSTKQTRLFRKISYVIAASTLTCIVAYLLMMPGLLNGGYQLREFSLSERLNTQLVVITNYINLFFLPDISNLALYQDTIPVSRYIGFKELVSGMWLGTVALVAWKMRSRQPIVSFGILLYFTSHIIESTILPLELAFEHRNYIGTIGLTISFVYWLSSMLTRTRFKKISYLLLPAIAILLGSQTASRATDWQSEMTLATASVLKRPASVRARISLATALMNADRPKEAVKTLDDFSTQHSAIVLPQLMAYYIQNAYGVNDPDRAKRIVHLLEISPVSEDTVSGLGNLAQLYQQLPEKSLAKSQILEFYGTTSKRLEMLISYRSQAALRARYAKLLLLAGSNELAVKEIRHASKLNSTNREIKLRLAETLAENETWDEVGQLLQLLKADLSSDNDDFRKRIKLLEVQLPQEISGQMDFGGNLAASAR